MHHHINRQNRVNNEKLQSQIYPFKVSHIVHIVRVFDRVNLFFVRFLTQFCKKDNT